MAATKPVSATDISEIQRQMAQIRNEMHQEVQGAVRSAQALTDWQAMVKSHPWLSLTIASLAGYLLVPRRHSPTPTIVNMSSPGPLMMPAAAAPAPAPKKSSWRFIGTALGLLAPVAVRAAQSYVLGRVEEWLVQNPLPGAPGTPAGASERETGRSTPRGTATRLREYG